MGKRSRGRPRREIRITPDERRELEGLAQRFRVQRNVAFRARIILLTESGLASSGVAARLRTTSTTVGYWRKRFAKERIRGLFDLPRPGTGNKLSDGQIREVVVKTLESRPRGATHWSTRLMAEASGYSKDTIARIWKAFGLKPQSADTHALSTDPFFIEKVRDVVGLYMSPPESALVLSFDEKSQIQALNRTQPILPMKPGQSERRTPDYRRHGTTTLFAALNVRTGKVIGKCYRRHRALEFRKFLDLVDAAVPADLQVHLILDNYATHKSPTIHRWLLRHTRFHLHFIPTHSSWLNLVERWFALLTERQIKRGAHTSVQQLEAVIREFIAINNESPKPFVWTKSADAVLENVKRFALRQLQAHAPEKMQGITATGH